MKSQARGVTSTDVAAAVSQANALLPGLRLPLGRGPQPSGPAGEFGDLEMTKVLSRLCD